MHRVKIYKFCFTEEAESFNNEWESRVRRYHGGNSHYSSHGHQNRSDHRQLALPDASGRLVNLNLFQHVCDISCKQYFLYMQ